MPRLTDHDEQRRRIAQATWAVIARDGVLRATVRAIAREAGSTTGLLSHYFRNQQELITFAFGLVTEDLHADLVAGSAERKPGLPRIRYLIDQFLPTAGGFDPQAAVTLACWSMTAGDGELARQYRDAYASIRSDATRFVTEAIDLGQIDADHATAAALADVLISFSDGLMVAALLEPDRFTATHRDAVIAEFLDRLCNGTDA
jgi:AcrR family transcriptional regulator